MKILVAYASAQGSTKEIAERIADRLREHKATVDCVSVTDPIDVAGYDAFVIGSAIHGQAWLSQARQFIQQNQVILHARPVWLYSVGMPGALGRPLRKWAMQEGPKATHDLQQLTDAVQTQLFSGVVERQDFPLVSRMIFKVMGGRYGDARDWPQIARWADGIASALVC